MGSIEVICGPMFSGKTEELMKRVRRASIARLTVKNFKPKIDDRYGEGISSHDGRNIDASAVNSSEEVEIALQNYCSAYGRLPDVVCIEEAQFFDKAIVQQIYSLKCRGVRVIVAGLDMDWKGSPFLQTAQLLALADKVDKQKAVCIVCGRDAAHSYKKSGEGDRIEVGETDKYEARCFEHWRENG